MIQVRDVFRLKFGKAKEAKALIQELPAMQKKLGSAPPKVYVDLTGPHYTMVLEFTHDSLAAYEKSSKEVMGTPEFGAWYQKFVPLVESGTREIYTLVE